MPASVRFPFIVFMLLCSGLILSAQPTEGREENALPPALDAPQPAPTDGPVIKLALLLDTSNSMDGLINQARTRLWQVVNEMGEARVEGQAPQLQVALFHYGNNDLSAEDGFVQLRCPFTTDLDVVSEQLFALSTNGGSEYCGAVIRDSVQRLDWSQPGEAPLLRLIVIAGNEPFNQGTEPFAESIATARGLEIRVNTIFCGPAAEGRATLWAEGARLGHGHFTAIDQNQAMPEIETPFDDALRRLDEALNATYRSYGADRAAFELRQRAQDRSNYAASPSAGLARASVKASRNYSTSHWDLVSAHAEGQVQLDELEAGELPDDLQGKSPDEQTAALERLAAERAAIAAEIRGLSAQREQFLAQGRRAAADAPADLGDALTQALRSQAAEAGFVFNRPAQE